MKNSQKGFIPIILIIIAVVAIGGGALVFAENTGVINIFLSPEEKEQREIQPSNEPSSKKDYIIGSDIRELDFVSREEMDKAEGCQLGFNPCTSYKGLYKGERGESFSVAVEIPNRKITTSEFSASARSAKMQAGDYFDGDYYMTVERSLGVISWISGDAIVTITTRELTSSNGDYFEDLLAAYLPLYPSDLKLFN